MESYLDLKATVSLQKVTYLILATERVQRVVELEAWAFGVDAIVVLEDIGLVDLAELIVDLRWQLLLVNCERHLLILCQFAGSELLEKLLDRSELLLSH